MFQPAEPGRPRAASTVGPSLLRLGWRERAGIAGLLAALVWGVVAWAAS